MAREQDRETALRMLEAMPDEDQRVGTIIMALGLIANELHRIADALERRATDTEGRGA